MTSYTFQDLLSVIVVSAPGFELEDDLDLDTAFQQLRDALSTLPAAQNATTRQNALDAIAAAHDAFRAGDLRRGGQQLQEVHAILYPEDAPARCIGSYGGPRVLVARDIREQWLGTREEGDHYDAACGVDDLGVIDPFGAPVLVLGCDGAVAGDEIEEHLALELEPGEWHVGYAYVERGDMAVSVYAIHRPG